MKETEDAHVNGRHQVQKPLCILPCLVTRFGGVSSGRLNNGLLELNTGHTLSHGIPPRGKVLRRSSCVRPPVLPSARHVVGTQPVPDVHQPTEALHLVICSPVGPYYLAPGVTGVYKIGANSLPLAYYHRRRLRGKDTYIICGCTEMSPGSPKCVRLRAGDAWAGDDRVTP